MHDAYHLVELNTRRFASNDTQTDSRLFKDSKAGAPYGDSIGLFFGLDSAVRTFRMFGVQTISKTNKKRGYTEKLRAHEVHPLFEKLKIAPVN